MYELKKNVFFIILIISVLCACSAKPGSRIYLDSALNRKIYEAYGKKFAISTQGKAATQAARLILDVNPAKADWVWEKMSDLVAAMRTKDTVENRGYLLVSK